MKNSAKYEGGETFSEAESSSFETKPAERELTMVALQLKGVFSVDRTKTVKNQLNITKKDLTPHVGDVETKKPPVSTEMNAPITFASLPRKPFSKLSYLPEKISVPVQTPRCSMELPSVAGINLGASDRTAIRRISPRPIYAAPLAKSKTEQRTIVSIPEKPTKNADLNFTKLPSIEDRAAKLHLPQILELGKLFVDFKKATALIADKTRINAGEQFVLARAYTKHDAEIPVKAGTGALPIPFCKISAFTGYEKNILAVRPNTEGYSVIVNQVLSNLSVDKVPNASFSSHLAATKPMGVKPLAVAAAEADVALLQNELQKMIFNVDLGLPTAVWKHSASNHSEEKETDPLPQIQSAITNRQWPSVSVPAPLSCDCTQPVTLRLKEQSVSVAAPRTAAIQHEIQAIFGSLLGEE